MNLKLLPALALLLTASTATPTKREALSPRRWDLRLFSASIPTCNPDESNIDLNVLHNYGFYGRNCSDVSYVLESEHVESLSWKSPGDVAYDICLFEDPECASEPVGKITDTWAMCYLYSAWLAYSVVPKGWEGCFGGGGQ